MTMQIFNFMLLWVATFTIVVSGFSIIDTGSSQSKISRVKIPLAMGLFDNILGQGKGKAGNNLAFVISSSNIALIII